MRVIEGDYVDLGLPPMMGYLDELMGGPGPTPEELASILECTVDNLYELLQGTRDITPRDIEALERRYAEASQVFVTGCQMMRAIGRVA